MPQPHAICKVSDLPPGERKIIDIAGRSIGIFNINGKFYALRNLCPHQAAPLCLGKITGTSAPSEPGQYHWEREGQIIRCPWHGWEFDITTGQSVFNPHKVRVKTYPVTTTPDDPESHPSTATPDDPSVETYQVTTENETLYVHI